MASRAGLGLLGFGSFGQFIVPHLRPYCDVLVHDRRPVTSEARALGVRVAPLAEVAGQPLVVGAVPVQELPGLLDEVAPLLRPGSLYLDVASVKVRPMALLAERLPAHVEYLGLHPMFGPQSGRAGIAGLKVALCAGRSRRSGLVARFLRRRLGLRVLPLSAEQHDAEMAYIQGLTHWMAKALQKLRAPDTALATTAYEHMMKIEELLGEDSWELFLTIQRENPYAAAARSELLAHLLELERRIDPPE